MRIEIGAPAILPLAFAQIKRGDSLRAAMLGVALQHPPVHIVAEKHKELLIYGPRAHIARQVADSYLQRTGFPLNAEIQIENVIPSLVGYGSDPILALTVAQALSWVNEGGFEDTAALARQTDLRPADALAYWGFARGGMLLVEMEAERDEIPILLRRHELKHKDKEAWAFVFFFPRLPDGTPETLENERQEGLLKAMAHLPETTGTMINELLWPALEQDDITAFGNGLMAVRKLNEEARQQAKASPEASEETEQLYSVFQEGGAVAWGQSLTGSGFFALVRGATASQKIRANLLRVIGHRRGQFSATITDNEGARYVIREEGIHDQDYRPIRTREG
jgi:predicted sugar kinase